MLNFGWIFILFFWIGNSNKLQSKLVLEVKKLVG
jgi:hypothetical protein